LSLIIFFENLTVLCFLPSQNTKQNVKLSKTAFETVIEPITREKALLEVLLSTDLDWKLDEGEWVVD
jgi:hypothetical protein